MTNSFAKALDLSAIGLSGMCLIHCLILPVLALAMPLLGAWSKAEWVHLLFVGAAAPVALTAFVDWSGSRPRSWPMTFIALVGLAFMMAGALDWPSERWERWLTVVGGVALAGAHIANWRRRSHACHVRAGAIPGRVARTASARLPG